MKFSVLTLQLFILFPQEIIVTNKRERKAVHHYLESKQGSNDRIQAMYCISFQFHFHQSTVLHQIVHHEASKLETIHNTIQCHKIIICNHSNSLARRAFYAATRPRSLPRTKTIVVVQMPTGNRGTYIEPIVAAAWVPIRIGIGRLRRLEDRL